MTDQSILLKHEVVKGILQFSPNKHLIHIYPKDLLLIHDWIVVHKIIDTAPGNITKNWLCEIPGFHEDEFPFVVCSGYETANLINVKTGTI